VLPPARSTTLFVVSGGAAGALAPAPHHRVGDVVAEDLAREPGRRATRQLGEWHRDDAALGPQSGKHQIDLGPREREHHQRPVA
jgi:hypothetical protein